MSTPVEISLDDDLFYVSTKLPIPALKIIDRLAKREMRTRSDYLRMIIIADLRQRGLVAPLREVA